MTSCGPYASVYLLSILIDFPPPLIINDLIALEGVCGIMLRKYSAYTSICISVWSLGSLTFLTTSCPPTVIIDFKVLQLPLIFRLSLISSSALAAETILFLCCFFPVSAFARSLLLPNLVSLCL